MRTGGCLWHDGAREAGGAASPVMNGLAMHAAARTFALDLIYTFAHCVEFRHVSLDADTQDLRGV